MQPFKFENWRFGEFDFWCHEQGSVFVRFLEEIEDTKKTFRNYLTFSNRIAKNIHLNYVLANSTCYCCCDIRIVINVYWFIKLIFWFKIIWNHVAVAQIQNIKGCLFKAVHFQTDTKTLRLASIYKLYKLTHRQYIFNWFTTVECMYGLCCM